MDYAAHREWVRAQVREGRRRERELRVHPNGLTLRQVGGVWGSSWDGYRET